MHTPSHVAFIASILSGVGQVALEFVSPQIAPSRLVVPYVAGWFGKPGG